MDSNEHVQIATTQENAVNLNPVIALVSEVTRQGLETLRVRLAEAAATSLQKLSIPETKLSQRRTRSRRSLLAPSRWRLGKKAQVESEGVASTYSAATREFREPGSA